MSKLKRDPILAVSLALAIASCFLIFPDEKYASYINWKTLSLLFSLMAVTAGMKSIGVFDRLVNALLSHIHSLRLISILIVLISTFMSMFLTNDVTLVTLVPFTILLFNETDSKGLRNTLIMETIGANLGSMLTPFGNPQNLFLYTTYGISFSGFIMFMLPYFLLSLMIILVMTLIVSPKGETGQVQTSMKGPKMDYLRFAIYLSLFFIAILSVAGFIDHIIVFAAVIIAMLLLSPHVLAKVDYSLLLTFIFFFIFIGNIGRLPAVSTFLKSIVTGHEMLTGIIASQFVSNVPAAILLSGFTDNGKALLLGTDIGGLGTIIASMASVITIKQYSRLGGKTGKYLITFTILNVIALAILTIFALSQGIC